MAIVAVDGKNFDGRWLDGVAHAIFWTEFALDEARLGGYAGPASVIPLGVDLSAFYPEDRSLARRRRGLPAELDGAFIVGNVNRNQPRKRWDLTVKFFAEWIKDRRIEDAWLYLHTAPTGDTGTNVKQLMRYYDASDRLALVVPNVFYGVSEEDLRDTYNSFDAQISTTQGEGFGLTTLEGMACGVPQLVPDWSALGDWARDAAGLVRCSSTAIGPPYLNVIGGVVDQRDFTRQLDALYRDRGLRASYRERGLQRATEPRFRWFNIGARYAEILGELLEEGPVIDELRGQESLVGSRRSRRSSPIAWPTPCTRKPRLR